MRNDANVQFRGSFCCTLKTKIVQFLPRPQTVPSLYKNIANYLFIVCVNVLSLICCILFKLVKVLSTKKQ